MIVLPFESAHLALLALQNAQVYAGPEILQPEYGDALAAAGPCFTAQDGSEVVGCLGLIHQGHGRALAWALLSRDAGRAMVSMHRGVRQFLDSCGVRRVEAAVDCDHGPALRWAHMLGFEVEGKMRAYTADRRDAFLFARVR